MKTLFSVNLNKLALLRNSRGSNYPNLTHFMQKMIDLGVRGFTVHPRPDERHITYQDCHDIKAFLSDFLQIEFNIEGNPNERFMALVAEVKPHQCTLVPDEENQLTSDHGFDVLQNKQKLVGINQQLVDIGTRCSVFIDPNIAQIEEITTTDIPAIEIYTEDWARNYHNDNFAKVKNQFAECIQFANQHNIRTNAGHDLNLDNLEELLALGDVAEVSIGHAFTVECIEQGIDRVVEQYLQICDK